MNEDSLSKMLNDGGKSIFDCYEFDTALSKANDGDGEAMYFVALGYFIGRGVEQDLQKAIAWLTKSIEKNCGLAFHLGGLVFLDERFSQYENEISPNQCFSIGALYGNGCCMYRMALISEDEGTCSKSELDEKFAEAKKAMENDLYKDKGYFTQYYLGRMYFLGQGCEVDYEQAFNYMLGAALKKVDLAYNEVGMCYFKGLGVEKNLQVAKRYFSLALEVPSLKEIASSNLKLIEDELKSENSSVAAIKEEKDENAVKEEKNEKVVNVVDKKYGKNFFITSYVLIAVLFALRIVGDILLYRYYERRTLGHYYIERFYTEPGIRIMIGCALKYYLVALFTLFLLFKGNKDKRAKKVLIIFILLFLLEIFYDVLRLHVFSASNLIFIRYKGINEIIRLLGLLPDKISEFTFELFAPIYITLLLLTAIIVGAFYLGLRFKKTWWTYLLVAFLPLGIIGLVFIFAVKIILVCLDLALNGAPVNHISVNPYDYDNSSDDKYDYKNNCDSSSNENNEVLSMEDKAKEYVGFVGLFVLFYNEGDWYIMDYYRTKRRAKVEITNDYGSTYFSAGGKRFKLDSINYYTDNCYRVECLSGENSF